MLVCPYPYPWPSTPIEQLLPATTRFRYLITFAAERERFVEPTQSRTQGARASGAEHWSQLHDRLQYRDRQGAVLEDRTAR